MVSGEIWHLHHIMGCVAQLVELWYKTHERLPPILGSVMVAGSSPVTFHYIRRNGKKSYEGKGVGCLVASART